MEISYDLPGPSIIKVFGVGGGGGNAVNHMYKQGIKGVDFIISNTDSQALDQSPIPKKLQIGGNLTDGRGAGSNPEVGRKAATESADQIMEMLSHGTKMIFITAGMGGGTGTGAAPVIAKIAREMGILTVGIVTSPFEFEGKSRRAKALDGIETMRKHVDTLIVINNERVRALFGNCKFSEAFANADNIVTTAAKGIAEIITVPGYVNVDFEDVRTVMQNSGVGIMGIGKAEGDERAQKAVKSALHSPLLSENDIHGARYVLLNIASGTDEVTMEEVGTITDYISDAAGTDAEVIWGHCYDENLGAAVELTLIATGFEKGHENELLLSNSPKAEPQPLVVSAAKTPSQVVREIETEPKPQVITGIETGSAKIADLLRRVETDSQPAQRTYPQPEPAKTVSDSRQSTSETQRVPPAFNPDNLNEIEKKPAYLRNRVALRPVQHSSKPVTSGLTLGEDGLQRKSGNSFLHDNVD